MAHAIIFANGRMNLPPDFSALLETAALVIAADGGLANCLFAGVQPHTLIGDLDSISTKDAKDFLQKGIEVIQHPTHKDETDLELALQYVVDKRIDEVHILGALGNRWDMTVANILLLTHPIFSHLSIHILDELQELTLLKPGTVWAIQGQSGMTVSLIPLIGDAEGITTSGLEYPLENETLVFGTTRGISNVFTDSSARISLVKGLLLCVINRINPIEISPKNKEKL